MNKALFLDRDGVINYDYGYVYKKEDFKFVEGIFDLCAKAQENGYKIIVITNQSGIDRGYFTDNDFQIINRYMLEEFTKKGINITEVFYCPYLKHFDRKPSPNMFLKAKEKYDIDMSASLSVGDNPRDIEAAGKAGVGRNYLFTDKKETVNCFNAVIIHNLNCLMQQL
jgi:D-glycero-D-manno-heptose 1,7-bisphosphate phosphatase